MSWKKWNELPDINQQQQQQQRVKSNPNAWALTPCSLLLTPSPLPLALLLLCSPLFDMLCLCPRLAHINPLSYCQPVLTGFSTLPPLPPHTIALESIQDSLCCTALLSLLANASGLNRECVDSSMNHFHSSRSQNEADSQTNDKKKMEIFADIDGISQICTYEMIKTLNTHQSLPWFRDLNSVH